MTLRVVNIVVRGFGESCNVGNGSNKFIYLSKTRKMKQFTICFIILRMTSHSPGVHLDVTE